MSSKSILCASCVGNEAIAEQLIEFIEIDILPSLKEEDSYGATR